MQPSTHQRVSIESCIVIMRCLIHHVLYNNDEPRFWRSWPWHWWSRDVIGSGFAVRGVV